MIRQAPFSLERDRTTAIQLEADMRRTADNGGALSFRAWADGSVVYEARVYASDAVVSGGQRKGMSVEDAFLHVLAHAGGDKGKEKGLFTVAAAQHVCVGGVEVWGRLPARGVEKRVEEPDLADTDSGRETEDVAPMASLTEKKLSFVFVARYVAELPKQLWNSGVTVLHVDVSFSNAAVVPLRRTTEETCVRWPVFLDDLRNDDHNPVPSCSLLLVGAAREGAGRTFSLNS